MRSKRKSLRKSVVVSFIIAVAITLIASILGFYLFVNNQTLNELVQINVEYYCDKYSSYENNG